MALPARIADGDLTPLSYVREGLRAERKSTVFAERLNARRSATNGVERTPEHEVAGCRLKRRQTAVGQVTVGERSKLNQLSWLRDAARLGNSAAVVEVRADGQVGLRDLGSASN